MDSDSVRVGVLSLHNSKETKAILNAVDDLGHEGIWLREENVMLDMDETGVTPTTEVDVIANRLLLSTGADPSNLLGLAASLRDTAPMLNPPCSTLEAAYKAAAYARLSDAGVPIPPTSLALSAEKLNRASEKFEGDWFIQKPTIGSHGDGTRRIRSGTSVSSRLGQNHSIVQEMITLDEAKQSDIRVYVVDGTVLGGMRRVAPDDDWRTNVAQGGVPEKADLTDEIKQIALSATEAVGLDYAGVDIMEGNNQNYVLEVNPTAGFRGFFKATGVSPAPYIAAAALERTAYVDDVPSEEIAEIAETLDDSYPTTPSITTTTKQDEKTTISFVENVRVSGQHSTVTVEGKADTGATRSVIDTSLAAELGAGPIEKSTSVRLPAYGEKRKVPIVPITIGVGDSEYNIKAAVQDRDGETHKLIIGRDILRNYKISLDSRL